MAASGLIRRDCRLIDTVMKEKSDVRRLEVAWLDGFAVVRFGTSGSISE